MTFRVTAAVLIPRPETELLLERALAISGPSGVAVDVGTGSGCLALSFALERPGWEVYATDTSVDALAVARQNMEAFGTGERVHLLCGSLLEPVSRPVNLVMANLPYVPAGDIPALEPEVRVWEPHAALDGGPDGLGPIRGLLAQLPEKIVPDGVCLLELDPRQFDELDRIVASRMPGWRVIRHQDLARRDRVAEVRAFTPS
jgi:release factor glutamine methyltransferase